MIFYDLHLILKRDVQIENIKVYSWKIFNIFYFIDTSIGWLDALMGEKINRNRSVSFLPSSIGR